MTLAKTIKDWILPIAMAAGASLYLIYHAMPEPVHQMGPFLEDAVAIVQPLLIFAMLFLTFCRIEPRELRPHRWHIWLLLIQGGLFVLFGLGAWALMKWLPGVHHRWLVLIESSMLCVICPTATAAAVVTRKLGGDVPGITTYIVLINILTAVLVPLIVPLVQPVSGVGFYDAFSMISAKVFPLLITPCLCAWLVRYLLPRVHRLLMRYTDLPFYLWTVALTLAIAVTTKSIVQSDMSFDILLCIALVSLVFCVFHFAAGRSIGGRYKPRRTVHAGQEDRNCRKITAGQSLGQKNTVFAIWMGYTFLTPETAIIGGFYSIWHNVYNSRQLYRAGRSD